MENSESILNNDQKDFIDKLGFYYESYGIPRIGGRILGYILLCDSPISAEHISSALGVSRASVSTNLRLLINYGLIEKKMVQQGRTDFYVMAKSAWENALITRINGFRSLMNILDTDSLSTDNSSVNEMREWCQLMYSIHEKALDEWKKRR
jgi:biotin operon repressor